MRGTTVVAWAWVAASLLVATAALSNEPEPEARGRTCSVRGGVVAFTEGGAVWRVNGETRAVVKLPTDDHLERAWCTDVGDDVVALYEVEAGEGGTGYLIRISPLGLVWSVNVLGFSFAEPLMAGDSVFVASSSTATRIDLGSGRVRWQRVRLRQGSDLAAKPRLEGSRLILSATRAADGSPARTAVLDARGGKTILRPVEQVPRRADVSVAGIFLFDPESVTNVLVNPPAPVEEGAYGLSLKVCNSKRSELLVLGFHPGSVANSYGLFRILAVSDPPKDCLLAPGGGGSFVTGKGIHLGISKRDLIGILGPGFTERQDGAESVVQYAIEPLESSVFLRHHHMPSYVGTYRFRDGRLADFEFGFPYP